MAAYSSTQRDCHMKTQKTSKEKKKIRKEQVREHKMKCKRRKGRNKETKE
jgi:hypothetical protein